MSFIRKPAGVGVRPGISSVSVSIICDLWHTQRRLDHNKF